MGVNASDTTSLAFTTALGALDHLSGGGRPGEVWLVAGPPGVGASSLALGLARAAALRSAVAVSWISTWQQPEEVAEAVLLAEAGVLVHRDPDGVLTADQAERLAEVTLRVQQARLVPLAVTKPDIMNTVIEQASASSVVVIDRLPEVGAASLDDLRDVAQRTSTWIVVVLPDVRRRAVHGLVRHAHLGVWVERPDVDDPTTDRAGEADLFVLIAGRRTPAPVTVAWQDRFRRFVDVST